MVLSARVWRKGTSFPIHLSMQKKGLFHACVVKSYFLDEISREILSDNLFLQEYYLNEISGNFISSLQYYLDEISPEKSPEIFQ